MVDTAAPVGFLRLMPPLEVEMIGTRAAQEVKFGTGITAGQ